MRSSRMEEADQIRRLTAELAAPEEDTSQRPKRKEVDGDKFLSFLQKTAHNRSDDTLMNKLKETMYEENPEELSSRFPQISDGRGGVGYQDESGVRVRFHIIRNARIENVGKSQSCMVSKLRIIWKRTRRYQWCGRVCLLLGGCRRAARLTRAVVALGIWVQKEQNVTDIRKWRYAPNFLDTHSLCTHLL